MDRQKFRENLSEMEDFQSKTETNRANGQKKEKKHILKNERVLTKIERKENKYLKCFVILQQTVQLLLNHSLFLLIDPNIYNVNWLECLKNFCPLATLCLRCTPTV